jgi:DNA repair protein RadD
MIGRGTRPWYSAGYDLTQREGRLLAIYNSPKRNCLVLDFARNTRDLGPINDPRIPKKASGMGGDAPVKICPKCGTYNHASVRFCINVACGHEFEYVPAFHYHAGTEELIKSEAPVLEWFNVNTVMYKSIDSKALGKPMLKVMYVCGYKVFSELVMFEHTGFARKKAVGWWKSRHWLEPPDLVAQALSVTNELRKPTRVLVQSNMKFPEVMNYEYE